MRFKEVQQEVVCNFTLSAAGPVLVASGSSTQLNPELADKFFVSGKADDTKEDIFLIPGSSIKGVIRHFLYDYLPQNEQAVEDLFGTAKSSQAQRSKIAFSDAYADIKTVKTALRNHTVIGPVSQAATRDLRNEVAVIVGDFHGGFRLRNGSDTELAWILRALYGFETEEICIGGSISRGFGRMRVSAFRMTVTQGYCNDLTPNVINTFTSLSEAMQHYLVGGGINV